MTRVLCVSALLVSLIGLPIGTSAFIQPQQNERLTSTTSIGKRNIRPPSGNTTKRQTSSTRSKKRMRLVFGLMRAGLRRNEINK